MKNLHSDDKNPISFKYHKNSKKLKLLNATKFNFSEKMMGFPKTPEGILENVFLKNAIKRTLWGVSKT